MRSRTLAALFLALPLSLSWGGLAFAQTRSLGSPTDLMAALKVGQWIKLTGPAGREPTVMCTEAKMLTGDFVDGDWQITGDVRRVDVQRRTLSIFTLPARLGEGAYFRGPTEEFKGLAQVRPGMFLNVEGTYLKDGTFVVKKVSEKSVELLEKPDHRGHVFVRGRIDRIDAGRRSLTVMGITFVITPATRVKSVIR